MAVRPLAFGVRLRDKRRTVRVRVRDSDSQRYEVEVRRAGRKTQKREHASLPSALQDLAKAWRDRLN